MGESREPATETIVIPSDLGEVTGVQDKILGAAEPFGFPDQVLFAMKLCLDEAVTNAIRHGNGGKRERQVTIRYRIDEDQIEVSVCDEGHGFDPGDVPDPTLDENLVRPCGRGVMLIQAYMTEVAYNERGNCVRMVKRRDCRLPHDQDPGSDPAGVS